MSAWEVLLAMCSGCFTAPSFGLFAELISAWVCCPTRRTVCAMIATMDLDQACAHDAYLRHEVARPRVSSLIGGAGCRRQ